MSNPETMDDLLEELRSGEYAPLADRLEAAMERETIIHTDNSKVNAALLEENERLAEALADAESRVKLWTDRADELRKKCDEQYAKLKTVGDAAKLREAVMEARRFVWASAQRKDRDLLVMDDEKRRPYVLSPKDTLIKMDTALAAPPRNCDVGTADEQMERFLSFARLYFQSEMVRLAMNWAQMPYEEGEK